MCVFVVLPPFLGFFVFFSGVFIVAFFDPFLKQARCLRCTVTERRVLKHSFCAAGNGRTTTGPNNPANWYDGFTGFKKLTNNEPPLAMRYSSPIRCKLTPEVTASTPMTCHVMLR